MADNGRKVRFILLLLLQCAPFVPNPVENRVQLFALPFISWPCWYSFIHSPSASPFFLLSLSLSFLCQLFSLPFPLLTLSCDPTPRWIEPLFDNIITESSRCGLKNWFIECFFTPLPFLPCLPTYPWMLCQLLLFSETNNRTQLKLSQPATATMRTEAVVLLRGELRALSKFRQHYNFPSWRLKICMNFACSCETFISPKRKSSWIMQI